MTQLAYHTVVTPSDTGLDVIRRVRDMQNELKQECTKRGVGWSGLDFDVSPDVQGSYKVKMWTNIESK